MNIFILNTLSTGIDTIDVLKKELTLKGVIGLSNRDPGDLISGYQYLKPYCTTNNLDFIEVSSYVLNNDSDKKKLLSLDIDVLIVTGWQRLIPQWLIAHCKICVIGAHGSMEGITKGRGRSPQNWALLLGAEEFNISIFKIDTGIDSGDIIDSAKYEISWFDDIKTSYYKVGWLVANMIIANIKNGNISSGKFIKQKEEGSTYLPQRLPEDGQLDWDRSSVEIYNFIRALTSPYPGAFTVLDDSKVLITKGKPFNVGKYTQGYQCGEIIKIYSNRDFLVKTRDSFFLVEEYNILSNDLTLKENDVFVSVDYKQQMQSIVARHRGKYPDLPLAEAILKEI